MAKNLDAASSRLAGGDRTKMEAHIGALRAIEHSLSTGRGSVALQSCGKPELGDRLDVRKNANIPALGRLQMDLLVAALACDLTRVGTIQFGRSGAEHRFNWLGPEFATDPLLAESDPAKGFHALAHQDTQADCRAKLVKIHAWYAGELAYLLDKLAAIPERNGTMLDNTLVVWVNELGDGGTHGHERTPWVLAGNVNGFLKTGQVVSFPGQPHNRVLLTICNALGVEGADFGDPDFNRAGPLTGVTA